LLIFQIAVPMSVEYEQFMRQLQETEDGEPLGKRKISIELNDLLFFSEIALANFTDEEGYGRFLDLHQAYEVYLNVKGFEVKKKTFSFNN